MKNAYTLSLRPYPGEVYFTTSKKKAMKLHKSLTGGELDGTDNSMGFCVTISKEGEGTRYIVFATCVQSIVHEMSHVVLNLFNEIGIDAHLNGGEAFCYQLDTLVQEAYEILNENIKKKSK
jgi:hypothetical protein